GRAARDLIARVEESGPCADAAGQAVVTFALLLARWVDGRTADTAELARDLLTLSASASTTDDGSVTIRAFALAHLGLAEVVLGRHDDGEAHLEEGLELARTTEVPYAELVCLVGLAWLGAAD